MTPDQIAYLIQQLKVDGVSFDAGLTDEEVRRVEQNFGFNFPPDLRAFLQVALPVSDGFVPWHWGIQNPDVAHRITEQRLKWPVDGLVFDAGKGSFWPAEWDARPATSWEREQLARQQLANCPPLIPIFSHRYLPAWPPEEGNPVFSVWGSDIVYYGYDLFSYFISEFTLRCPPGSPVPAKPRHIAFWGDFDEPKPREQWGYWEEPGDENAASVH